jgi:hypothetical protein
MKTLRCGKGKDFGRKMGRAERSEILYFCLFHLSAILANGDWAVGFRVIPPKFVLNRAKSWQKNNFLSGLIREIRGSRSFLVLGSELSNANTEFRRGRARQLAPQSSLLPPRKFCACRAVTKSIWGSTEPHPTKRRKEEIMKRTLEMERVNCAACDLLVQARQQAFIVAKKGRKAFQNFSKNARHFSKNIVTLTLNFENFSDLIFYEQNPPPPRPSQTVRSPGAPAAVAPERRFGAPRRRKDRRTPRRFALIGSHRTSRQRPGVRRPSAALTKTASRHTMDGESHPVAVSSSDFVIAFLPPGFEPRNSAKPQQTSTTHRKLSAYFRLLPDYSAFFRVSGKEGLRQKGGPAKGKGSSAAIVGAGAGEGYLYRQSDPNRAVVGQRTQDLCNYFKSNYLQIKRDRTSPAQSKWIQAVQDPVILTRTLYRCDSPFVLYNGKG